jgi:hypothetical protein
MVASDLQIFPWLVIDLPVFSSTSDNTPTVLDTSKKLI